MQIEQQPIIDFISHCKNEASQTKIQAVGKIKKIVGLVVEATGCYLSIGSRCEITIGEGRVIEAEVIGFTDEVTFLMPLKTMTGLLPNSSVKPINKESQFAVGNAYIGRIVDGLGYPIDNLGAIKADAFMPINGEVTNPLSKNLVRKPLDVGIKSINALLTIGEGQRIGLFAGSGVGKSILLGMITKFTEADVVIVALIGERGREVNEFVQNILGSEGMQKTIVIAVPADTMPLERINGAKLATTFAEFFRAQGKKVLLLLDSLTRFAQAQREISLSIGEPPITKGYPPTVFSSLPKLIERAGCTSHAGSITAIYTVLTEGDDQMDPIADASRAILDGHIVLSRQLAEAGIYPAINIEASISRVITSILPNDLLELGIKFRELLFRYNEKKDVINLGIYKPGSNADVDEAIQKNRQLIGFIKQNMHEPFSLQASHKMLKDIFNSAEGINES